MSDGTPLGENIFAGRSRKNTNTDPTQVIDHKQAGGIKKPMHQFPDDLGHHSFHMLFHKYDFDQEAAEAVMSIALPMPQAILDKYGIEYNNADLTTAGAIGAGAISTGTQNILNREQTVQQGSEDFNKITKNFISGVGGVIRDLNPIETIKNASNLGLGNIVNPHTALLFNAVKLKEFEFSWKLYPRQKSESTTLQEIIKQIKKLSHPKMGNFFSQDHVAGGINNFHLEYPHEVDLFYVGGHTGLEMHRFKRCAITSLSVNYTPEGGPQFIAGSGAPAFVELTIGFTETQIWTADDFDMLEAFPEKDYTANIDQSFLAQNIANIVGGG